MSIRGSVLFLLLLTALAAAWIGSGTGAGPVPHGIEIRDREGGVLRVVLSPDEQDARPVDLASMGEWIGPALIAAEDRRFYGHPGVDPLAILRAVGQNLGSGRVVSGASTISTQVIRMRTPRSRTLGTKVAEAAEAVRLEAHADKDEILRTYLNLAPFGGNLAGVEAASRAWFGKPAAALSLPEAALLAGLPQSPSRLRPDRNPEGARERRDYVLGRMEALGFISSTQRERASAHSLPETRTAPSFRAPHFTDWLLTRRDPAPVWSTTLDMRLQDLAERELRRAVDALAPHGVDGGAVVIIENRPRAIRAMVGSPHYSGSARLNARRSEGRPEQARPVPWPGLPARSQREAGSRHAHEQGHLLPWSIQGLSSHRHGLEAPCHASLPVRENGAFPDVVPYGLSGQVNAAITRRSPGSALKPFAYLEALDRGLVSPARMLADVPLVFPDYRPSNFDPGFRGPVSARDALILSLNIPALALTRDLGPEGLLSRLREAGLASLDAGIGRYGVALVLGAGDVALLELAEAYATLASGGVHHPLRALESDPLGEGRRMWSAEACWLVADMLGGPERSLDLHGHVADAVLPRFAWKTGTSSGHRDAWTVAWNPDYTVAVWVGNPDGRGSPRLVGIEAAAPVAGRIFRGLVPAGEGPWFEPPTGLFAREVCAVSGMIPGRGCGAVVGEKAIRGVSPTAICSVHRVAADGTVTEAWPEPIRRWMTGQSEEATAPARPRIVAPVEGQTFVVPSGQDAVLSLRAEGGEGTLHWFANGGSLGATAPGQPLVWAPAPGAWELVCSDGQGRADRVRVRVERRP